MENKKKIRRLTSSRKGDDYSIEISGITKSELNKIEKALVCGNYIAVHNDKIVSYDYLEPLPTVTDDKMLPFWRPQADDFVQAEFIDHELPERCRYQSPGFVIQHLCGYNYSEDNYKFNAEILESVGFECMRSKRGPDGKYWEQWYHSGLWSVKGRLKDDLEEFEAQKKRNTNEKIDFMVNWLCRQASFGTIDLVYQRAGLSLD